MRIDEPERPSAIRIAVSGYYGCGNTGDEAVLAGIVESFGKRCGPDGTAFTVLSADPADTERRHGLKAVDRMNPRAVRQTLRPSDLMISGGGSLLQDTTSVRSLVYYLLVVRAALRLRTPVMFYAQGLGPLRRRSSRFMTRVVANRVQYITVRDQASAALLREIGVSRPPIEVTADPAFALEADPRESIRCTLIEAGAPIEEPLLGIALRPWAAGSNPEKLAQILGAVISATKMFPVFLPMQPPGDVEISQAVGEKLGCSFVIISPASPRQAVGLAGAMSMMLAMRLHALIFAARKAVPILALSYDPKVAQLMAELGQSRFSIELSSASAASVAQAAGDSVNSSADIRSGLKTKSEEMSERALVNVDRALAVIERQ